MILLSEENSRHSMQIMLFHVSITVLKESQLTTAMVAMNCLRFFVYCADVSMLSKGVIG